MNRKQIPLVAFVYQSDVILHLVITVLEISGRSVVRDNQKVYRATNF